MGIWSSLGSLFGRRPGPASAWSASWMASFLSAGMARPSSAGELVDFRTAGALPAVYRAVSFISDALASVELRVVQVQPDGGKDIVTDSDAAQALAEWSYEQREMFVYWAALGGNGFAVIRRNENDGIERLESVPPVRVMAMQDEAQRLFFAVTPNADSPKTEQPEVFAQSDVLHLKFRHTGDGRGRSVLGLPPIVTAAEQLGLVLAARSFQSKIWERGAMPIGILKTANLLKPGVIDRVRAQWNDFYQGGKATGKVAVLEQGLEFQPVKPGLTPADSDLVEYNRFGVEEVSRLYAVPPSVLGQTHNASYSTASEEYRAAVMHCLRPWAARFSDCLSRALLTREQRVKGMRVEAKLDQLGLMPGKESADYYAALISGGVICTDEARNAIGLPDLPNGIGAVHRIPANTAALENLPKLGLGKQTQQEPQT